jgi:lipoprotein-releasing system permease protein
MIGAGGWLFGSALGFALLTGFSRVAINADGSPLFPVVLTAQLFWSAGLLSTIVGALAALVPARRASRLDPAVAIRNA